MTAGRKVGQHFEFKLLENGLDFVLAAAEHAQSESPRDLKYAILNLAGGIELLLKARLEKEHWSLVFADVDKANRTAKQSGDFRSVDFDSARLRLREVAGVSIPQQSLKHLNELRLLRNKIQHFAMKVDKRRAQSLLAIGHNFVIDFVKANLADDMGAQAPQVEEIRKHLNEFQEFVDHRLASLKTQLHAVERVTDCPECWQEAMVLDDGQPRCLFCDFQTDFETLARERSETGVVRRCPLCDELACTVIVFNNDDAGWHCIACDERGDYEECMYCEEGLTTEGVRCSECLDYIMSKDD